MCDIDPCGASELEQMLVEPPSWAITFYSITTLSAQVLTLHAEEVALVPELIEQGVRVNAPQLVPIHLTEVKVGVRGP